MINRKFYERKKFSSKNVLFIREEEYSTNCHYAIRVVCFAEKMWGDILSPGRTDDTFWALFDITEFQNIYFDPHILVLLGGTLCFMY